MKTRIVVIRHGETEWNNGGIVQGQLDSPLTALGRMQAQAVARRLKNERLDLLYSSDLGRAMETAQPIADATGHTIHLEPRIREKHFGVLQGLSREQFAAKDAEASAAFLRNDPDYVLPGGESTRGFLHRVTSAYHDLAAKHRGQTIVTVSHGGVVAMLFRAACGVPLTAGRKFSLYNASYNVFTIEGDALQIETWGDISHLASLNTSVDFE